MGQPVEPAEPEQAEQADDWDPGELSEITPREPEEEEYEEDPKETAWIEISLVDFSGEPVSGERFKIRLENGMVIKGTLDPKGFARIENIPEGTHKVLFPRYDREALEKA